MFRHIFSDFCASVSLSEIILVLSSSVKRTCVCVFFCLHIKMMQSWVLNVNVVREQSCFHFFLLLICTPHSVVCVWDYSYCFMPVFLSTWALNLQHQHGIFCFVCLADSQSQSQIYEIRSSEVGASFSSTFAKIAATRKLWEWAPRSVLWRPRSGSHVLWAKGPLLRQ